MAWAKPVLKEIECGMEINMYGPDAGEDDFPLF
ncbi:coenzyme PQQ precursor peptide PqqA [Marivivens niveibacter]|uniref:Coenzyme PQQ synthesis protein A n=1 Tax=Marivivens niveibacter TaxID=1930667 RepID=A0A251WVQ0_9RHOB|nr:pyrroloquinoline quinone precursor peptide PqqA [Marivivens niveibacter]OUD08462.1 coenzyme PQQ precursor peptide PqqA [Marivivens niveibacter]